MQRDLEIDLLRSFVAVAAQSNFTRAGRAVGRTQSAVSLQIKRLEDIVGKSLFARDRHSVTITRAGEDLLVYANRILDVNDAALSQIRRPAAEGLVRVGAPDDYATFLLPPILTAFNKEHPRVRFEVTCDNGCDLIAQMEADEVDLVLATHPQEDVAGEIARFEPMHWVAAPDFVDDPEAALSLVLFPKGCVCRGIALQALKDIERDWHIAYSTRSIGLMEHAILAGSGVSVMEASIIPDGLRVIDGYAGLPPLPEVVIAVHRNAGDTREPVSLAGDFLLAELGKRGTPKAA